MNRQMWVLCNILLVLGLFAQINYACQGGRLLKTGVTEQEKYQILETHNRLRQSVAQGNVHGQPGAENMMEMQWDEELAAKAQQWANQCIFEHDQSRYLGRFIMGQNLAIMWSTDQLAEDEGDFPSRIQNWFNEVSLYAFGSPYSSKTGHYSQLIWGQSNLVGCGFSYYYDGYKYSKLWVCNYGPGGNVVGEDPYATGRPSCSSHGLGTSSRYPGLCTYGSAYPSTDSHFSNVIPDTSFNYKAAFDDSVSKYKQYTVTPSYSSPAKVQKILPLATAAPSSSKHNDYTFSSFGFNGGSAWNSAPKQNSVAPAYKFVTTPKPVVDSQPAAVSGKHSAFYTYNWDSLFNNYYSYNNVRK